MSGLYTDTMYVLPLALERDLHPVSYVINPGCKEGEDKTWYRRPYPSEVEVFSFPQVWGDTTLGFGGVGGQTMTTAQTTVVRCGDNAVVYFGCRLAYNIEHHNQKFQDDLSNMNMAERAKARTYRA